MKQKLAELQERIRRAERFHEDADDLDVWHVLSLLNELVDMLVGIYGKPEEADSEG